MSFQSQLNATVYGSMIIIKETTNGSGTQAVVRLVNPSTNKNELPKISRRVVTHRFLILPWISKRGRDARKRFHVEDISFVCNVTPNGLLAAVFYYNGINFVLHGGEEHHSLNLLLLLFRNLPDIEMQGQLISCVGYTEHDSKKHLEADISLILKIRLLYSMHGLH